MSCERTRTSTGTVSAHPRLRGVLLLACASILAIAQFAAAQTPRGSILRIGYMATEDGSGPGESDLELFAESLWGDEAMARLLRAEGFRETGLIRAESERDLLLRLNAGELDVAFVPARMWAEQEAGYEAVLQVRRAGDSTRTRGQGVMRRGVVFAGPGSPWSDPDAAIRAEDVGGYLRTHRVAAVGSQSMAGYVAPMLKLSEEVRMPRPAENALWFRSDAEVVQAVVAGLADVGVCGEDAFEAARAELEGSVSLRLMYRSVPVPADPVVVHPRLSPRRSETGREVRRALRDWFQVNRPAGLTLENAQDPDFAEVRALLGRWRALASEAN